MEVRAVAGRQPAYRTSFFEIYFVYAIIFSTGAFYFQLTGIDPSTVEPGDPLSPLARINSLFIYVSILAVSLIYWRRIQSVIVSSWPLFVFPALALVSCLWALDPMATLRRSIGLLVNLITIAALVAILPPLRVVRVYVIALGVAMLCSVLWVTLLPSYGTHMASDWIEPKHAGLWRGIYTHKNTLGNLSAIALVMFAFFGKAVIRSRVVRVVALLAAVACLVGSRSGTGFVTAGLMTGVVLFFRSLARMNKTTRMFFGGISLLLITLLTFVAIPLMYFILEALGKSPDLTGRLPLWFALIVWSQERPWLGFGYSTGFELELMPRVLEYIQARLPNAHNGYLETFISFGYVGLAALVVLLASFLIRIIKSLVSSLPEERIMLPFITCLFFNALFSNITESLFFAQNDFFNMSFALAYILLSSLLRTAAQSRARTVRPLILHNRATGERWA